MTSSVSKSSIFIAFVCLLLLLLLSVNGFRMLDENPCQDPSATFSGACFDENRCNTQCKTQEGALRGFCPGFECWCEFSCNTVCARDSGLWTWGCVFHVDCSKQCRHDENAFTGRCSESKISAKTKKTSQSTESCLELDDRRRPIAFVHRVCAAI